MYSEDRKKRIWLKPALALIVGIFFSRKEVNSKDKEVKINKDGTTTTWYSDGSSAHEGVMVGRTNYDKDTGEEC